MSDTLRGGAWLLRRNGEIVRLERDPATQYHMEPFAMPEKEPTGPTHFVNASDAYTRYVLRDGPKSVGVYYASGEASESERVRLLAAMYG